MNTFHLRKIQHITIVLKLSAAALQGTTANSKGTAGYFSVVLNKQNC